jgi:predicted dithiol-disulfide oxidoreductase (DUF899 family)
VQIPKIATRQEWLVTRLDLLEQEKAASRAQAALAEKRRALPMVEIDDDYVFEGPAGRLRLVDLFEGRSQLIIYHFMWRHDIDDGCPSCSFAVDNMPNPVHLNEGADTTLALVTRAPFERIEKFRTRMGWSLPWYSSDGSDFNFDFHVTNDEAVAPVEYNYKDKETMEQSEAMRFYLKGDGQGFSVFLRDNDRVFHTYSTYGAGVDFALGTYKFLDVTPLGRQHYVNDWPYHDTYGTAAIHAHHH